MHALRPPARERELGVVSVQGLFSAVELDRIVQLAGEEELVMARVGDDQLSVGEVRRSAIAWLPPEGEYGWIYERLVTVVEIVNDRFFGYALSGFADDLQYTVYEGEGHYGWHVDSGGEGRSLRKLSLTVQLSDPGDYDGGELWTWGVVKERVMPVDRGTVHCFPATLLHRVTPVTRGTRRSLVAWVVGPDWR